MWARPASAALGACLTAAPGVLGYGDPAAIDDHIVGPIAAGSGFVAAWPLPRSLRWVELVAGARLLVAPWILRDGTVQVVNDLVVGLLLVAFAFLGAKTGKSLDGGWTSVLPFLRRAAREEP